jgi:hypothetical protein
VKTFQAICVIGPLLAAGCGDVHRQGNLPTPAAPEQELTDAALLHELGDAAVHNAILTQHTLFPYHFVNGTAELNELGTRDLTVLSEHYRRYGGSLNVRRGDATDQLYRQRVDHVTALLAADGVPAGRVAIADGPPGGSGTSSDQVITMLRSKEQPTVEYQTPGKVSVPAVKGEQP